MSGLHNNYAMSLAMAGDFADAVAELGQIAKPDAPPRYRLNLALAYGLAGDDVHAAEAARQVLDEASVQNNLAYYALLRGMDETHRTAAIIGAELHGTPVVADAAIEDAAPPSPRPSRSRRRRPRRSRPPRCRRSSRKRRWRRRSDAAPKSRQAAAVDAVPAADAPQAAEAPKPAAPRHVAALARSPGADARADRRKGQRARAIATASQGRDGECRPPRRQVHGQRCKPADATASASPAPQPAPAATAEAASEPPVSLVAAAIRIARAEQGRCRRRRSRAADGSRPRARQSERSTSAAGRSAAGRRRAEKRGRARLIERDRTVFRHHGRRQRR